MNPKKKIFILLPDGVGLRNFAFTSFVEIGGNLDWEVVFWNQTPFDLQELGYREIKLTGRVRRLTDVLKRARIEAELDHFSDKFNDPVYQTYKFPASKNGLKARLKNNIVRAFVKTHKGDKGLKRLRQKMKASERRGVFYKRCKAVLEQEQPDLVFCTNQRPVNALAPLTAAKDLGIPTGSFIFSWDNLPKATMVVDTDHYFVWSEYMKKELLNYYSFINREQIHVTGSPQFEPHFDQSLRKSREDFFRENNLDPARDYICFSGDDITTSPDDPQYLSDLAEAVQELNSTGKKLGIIFRRCPVDFSQRYDKVIKQFKGLIIPIAPKWKKAGENWNTILPTKEDLELQVNTILHSEAVINVGSSMVFDFAIFGKPCLYINYEVKEKKMTDWSTEKIYNFIHFRSMPTGEEVFWLNSKKEIPAKLEQALGSGSDRVQNTVKWFEQINLHPPQKASERIWEVMDQIKRK